MRRYSESEKALIDKLVEYDNFNSRSKTILERLDKGLEDIRIVEDAIDRIIKEKTQGFPWLADAISQYYEMRDLKIAEFMEKKLHPAKTSAERLAEISREKREIHKKFIITRNYIKYYEALFPWLTDFVGEDIDEILVQMSNKKKDEDGETDPVHDYVTKGEYEQLSTTERNQRALDRYWKKKKSSWELGRDYERYVGYQYEKLGYSVYYQGIEKGLEDLGRDLICKKDNQVEIVQCKYWRESKTIHEKHINQLFGTTVEYVIKNMPKKNIHIDLFHPGNIKSDGITAAFITSCSLSETAKEFASILSIKVLEHFKYEKYPSIKCNVSYKDKSKIYHLPFDQQYDRTGIDEERNECYVETVKEAENLGFRRAWRWKGN